MKILGALQGASQRSLESLLNPFSPRKIELPRRHACAPTLSQENSILSRDPTPRPLVQVLLVFDPTQLAPGVLRTDAQYPVFPPESRSGDHPDSAPIPRIVER